MTTFGRAGKSKTAKLSLALIIILGILIGIAYLIYVYTYWPIEPVNYGGFLSEPAWEFFAEEPVTATPLIHGNQMYVRTAEAGYCIDLVTRETLWISETSGTLPLSVAPQVVDGILIVPEEGAGLAGFWADTGELLWRTPPAIDINPKNPYTAKIDALLVWQGIIYVARYDWKLSAYELKSGKQLWQINASGRADLDLAIDDQALYLSGGHFLRAYGLEYVKMLWEREFDELTGPILLEDGILYLGLFSESNSLMAIDLETGDDLWQVQLGGGDGADIRSLVLNQDVIYVGAHRLFAVSKTKGEILWMSEKTGLLEQPLIVGERIYVRNTETVLYIFDLEAGREIGHLSVQTDEFVGHYPPRGPAVFDDLLIVPFGDERIFFYKIVTNGTGD